MHSRLRKELIVPLALLLVAVGGIAAWSFTRQGAFLALGIGGAFSSAAYAVVVGWRLGDQVRRLERLLRDGERMRLLGQVAGGLAHQLRNGVAGAKLAAQLHARACTEVDGESLEVARRQLARVESDLARFLDLGRADVVRRPCHVVELVEEAAALLRPQYRHADVQLCWEPPAANPVVIGDSGRLAHVVVNLLTNAMEAAGAGGHVEVIVDPSADGKSILEVWDSGPGPSAKVARRLFRPFVTGRKDGVGLGLFVARQAAEAHGGRLDWRRERGRTCFRVELPAGEGENVEQPVVATVRS
jgi:signal transduction histidine kinase